jgi:ABC-2 type transport system permease protein
MKWLAVLIKESKVYLSDKNALIQLFMVPMLVITLANFAMQKIYNRGAEGMISVPAVDQDQSEISQRLLGEIKKAGIIHLEETYSEAGRKVPMSEAYARGLIAEKHARTSAIIIPAHFQATLLSKQQAEILLLENPLDKIDPMIAKSVLTIMSDRIVILRQRPLEVQGRAAEKLGELKVAWGTPTVAVKTESAMPAIVEKMDSLKQNVPGFAIMFAMFSLVWGGMSIALEREHGTFARLLSAPISKLEILSGKLLVMFAITCAQLLVFFSFGHFVFGMHLGHSIAGLALLSMTLALTTTSLGVFLASFAKTQIQLGVISSLLVLGMSALGGSWWPLEFMPDWMQKAAHFVTINAWAMDGYKNLIWYGGGLASILPQAGLLAGFALCVFSLGLWKFRFE